MRFHHHTTRSVCRVRETAAQSLIVQHVTTQSQSGASVCHRSARATSETGAPILQHDSFGAPVKQDATRAGQDVLILQGDPMRPDPRTGDLDLTASQRKDFLGVLVADVDFFLWLSSPIGTRWHLWDMRHFSQARVVTC